MPLALDHVFVLVAPGAPGHEPLGLRESVRRRHHGQGTRNVCFGFDDAFLELLWVDDEAEASAAAVERTGIAARARSPGASLFGIALRSTDPADVLPFETWSYEPPYLPPGVALHMGLSSADVDQPLVFCLPRWQLPDAPRRRAQDDLGSIRGLRLATPVDPCPELRALAALGLVVFEPGPRHRLHVSVERRGGAGDHVLSLPLDLAASAPRAQG